MAHKCIMRKRDVIPKKCYLFSGQIFTHHGLHNKGEIKGTLRVENWGVIFRLFTSFTWWQNRIMLKVVGDNMMKNKVSTQPLSISTSETDHFKGENSRFWAEKPCTLHFNHEIKVNITSRHRVAPKVTHWGHIVTAVSSLLEISNLNLIIETHQTDPDWVLVHKINCFMLLQNSKVMQHYSSAVIGQSMTIIATCHAGLEHEWEKLAKFNSVQIRE